MNPKKRVFSKGFSAALLLVFLIAPAHAEMVEESAESYYGRQMKSCFYKKERTSIWDLFAATRPVYLDDCCAQSVYAMEKAGAEWIHPDKDCPEGSVKASMKCETSKHWCVPVGAIQAPPPE